VTDEELNWLYDNAATYVFPSLMEGFGLPGLEAMGHNLPVVSSNATCLPEVYGDAAIYFDPLNVEDMAEKISLVLDSKDMQMQLAAEGQKQLKKYSWKKMAKETHAVYMKVLHERG
jgi:glycosyltransferase involved in cell wall biosynthesis